MSLQKCFFSSDTNQHQLDLPYIAKCNKSTAPTLTAYLLFVQPIRPYAPTESDWYPPQKTTESEWSLLLF